MQTVSCLSGQCIGIAEILRSRSRMQMNHQILDSVQAVAILVKEGGIGVSKGVERDGLFYSGIRHPFLENVCGQFAVSPLKISPSPAGPHASMASAETG